MQAGMQKAERGAAAPSVIDLRDAPLPIDPSPRRQVRIPLLLSFAGDAIATIAAVGITTSVLPWAQPPSLPLEGLMVLVCLASFAVARMYERPRLARPGAEVLAVTRGVMIAGGALLATAVMVEYVLSRTIVTVGAPILFGSVLLVRMAVRVIARRLQARGLFGVTTLVVGTNDEARSIARTINRTGWLGYRVAGFVWTGGGVAPDTCEGMPVVARLDDLDAGLEATDARAVVVTTSDVSTTYLPELVALADRGIEVRTTAAFKNTNPSRVAVDGLDGIPLIAVRPRKLTEIQRRAKRAFDVAASAALLTVAAPVMATIALVVRLGSGPGVIFSQDRIGEGGRRFRIYKFRTMVRDAEALREQLRQANEAEGALFKMKDDPRITPVGRFLRKTALDELPQLVNVLKGDMSMVGPRPPLVEEVEAYDDEIARRLEVKPGLTGLWQVSGRHELGWDDYVRYDTYYVDNWSVGLDLTICARTVPALLSRKGSY